MDTSRDKARAAIRDNDIVDVDKNVNDIGAVDVDKRRGVCC